MYHVKAHVNTLHKNNNDNNNNNYNNDNDNVFFSVPFLLRSTRPIHETK